MKVCVVGGGTAGVEAAREASRNGCDVTLVDTLERPFLPWRSWPDLIRQSHALRPSPTVTPPLSSFAKEVHARATYIAPGVASTAEGLHITFDTAVLATGYTFEPTAVSGQRRAGVFVLDGPSPCARLGNAIDHVGRAIVQGEGPMALQVADRLSTATGRASVFITGWQHPRPGRSTWGAVERAAADRGVTFLEGAATKAIGSGAVEAAICGGRVVATDALVLVPRRIPRVVPGTYVLGPRGGVLVDRSMRTTSPRIFAAGASAELGPGAIHPAFEAEAAPSGRVAGANSSGGSATVPQARVWESSFFGLRWSRWELRYSSPQGPGMAARTVTSERGPYSSCTIRYDRLSGRVVSVETVEEEGSSHSSFHAATGFPFTLRALAYGELVGSSDISLVSDTARAGLEEWSRS